MEEIDDLILFENENVRLDFKREEYHKDNFTSFLKDIISMANAFTREDRFIIIGLKPTYPGNRGIVGLRSKITDAAIYQQLVYENIEPDLAIDYFSYKLQQNVFGIFRLSSCNNPPYMMKKEFGNGPNKLHKGDSYIRKGTHQTRLIRSDYDKYLQNRITDNSFTGEVEFILETNSFQNVLLVKSLEKIKRPSQVKKEKIETILEKKRKETELFKNMGIKNIFPGSFNDSFAITLASIKGTEIPYENRDIPTLENNLKKVEGTYLKHDLFEIYEKQATKYNLSIYNKGNQYIEDATIIIKIPKIDGLFVSTQIYPDPNKESYLSSFDTSFMYYPDVKENDQEFLIKEHLGNIRHLIKTDSFQEPLRIIASDKIEVESFVIKIELYAKNILTKIEKELTIEIKNSPNS
ncbi:MAG TPA: ATP-binding protein [Bacteroidales bacterium]|nr:ATP-binding protein [Bacteroidales bacterium]HCI55034.1 hypothetical protein [Bacteroidales bacterium]HOU96811.1 ATP-binding protein [Bacteroidales bacterium]HQG37371.1 ATP-binding protein [Bacteroidales bacterium]HQG52008.1 ATP-binding protein [Bacteroidales bacterium]